MNLFVIQSTYSLHSLLRPNRSLDNTETGANQERSHAGTRERPDADREDDRALCDA